ncbi:MAG: DUF2752 domain-containing protein [Pyrinomonadaceae bacterium]
MQAHVNVLESVNAQARERLLIAALTLATLAALLFLHLYNPVSSGLYPPCPFHALTGLHCPGCGTLRGLHQLLHGNLAAAFAFNPLMVLSLPFIGYGLISRALFGFTGRALPKFFIPPLWIKLLFVVVMAFWILRNIPSYPFTLLAPHSI